MKENLYVLHFEIKCMLTFMKHSVKKNKTFSYF